MHCFVASLVAQAISEVCHWAYVMDLQYGKHVLVMCLQYQARTVTVQLSLTKVRCILRPQNSLCNRLHTAIAALAATLECYAADT